MIGLVLVTHGNLGREFLAALEHVVGPQDATASISMGSDDNVEERRTDIISAVRKVEGGNGVVVLTDMFGGTPSNLAISIMEKDKVEVLAGVNLPMLIKLASVRRTHTLADAVMEAQDAGRKYIHLASALLSEG